MSITLSPLHLLFPVLELEVEAAIAPHFSLGIIGGAGTVEAQTLDPSFHEARFSVYELGSQVIGYPLRDFSGLQFGGQVKWLHLSTTEVDGQAVDANAGGLAVGPFIGYKVLAEVGFTFVVQGGFQYAATKANASDSEGSSDHAEQEDFLPLLNLHLGWSF